AVSLAVTLTIYTPAMTLYRVLPGLAWFRKPQRILFLYAVAMSVLSGVGLDGVAHRRGARSGTYRSLAIAGGFASTAAALVVAAAPPWRWVYLAAASMLLIGIMRNRDVGIATVLIAALCLVAVVDLIGAARNPYLHPIHQIASLDAAASQF